MINECIPDPRDRRYTMYGQMAMLIALGSENLKNHQTLRTTLVFQVAVGEQADEDCPLASLSTLGRLKI